MDRPTNRKDADEHSPRHASPETFVLPSRRAVMNSCGMALSSGPVLLTGDAGAGKTWLWRRIRAEWPNSTRWLSVDVTPADGPADFYQLLGHELGLVGRLDVSRIGLINLLIERHADGDRPILVVEEAQNLSVMIWEEVRILANRLGEPGGFSGMIFVGQTTLARRFSTRALAGFGTRLAARLHLGPIDADEARELLIRVHPSRNWMADEIEILHRDAFGNPGRMLQKIGPDELIISPSQPEIVKATRPEPIPTPSVNHPTWSPLIVEDHVIEVGWSADQDLSELEPTPGGSIEASITEEGEEEVRDHYAALQAWREWSENQVRRTRTDSIFSDLQPSQSITEEMIESVGESEEIQRKSPIAGRSTVWADPEQAFAPLGQLFSRLARARDPE